MSNINDVAAAANVSVATVSKAFNGYKDISEETRQRIFKIAQDLDYSPNQSAVELVRKQKNYIGLILSGIGQETARDEFLIGIISGVYKQAEACGYNVMMFTTTAIHQKQLNYVSFCRSHNLLGAIIHGLTMDDTELPHLLESEVPCVLLDINQTGKKTANISIDNEKACTEVIDYLVSLNHRHIAYMSGSIDAEVSMVRQLGYYKGLQKNNVKIRDEYIVHGEFNELVAYEKSKQLLTEHPEITAFFAASDLMAIGVLNACYDLNKKVPEDISIVGFDNLTFTNYVRPPLTTISQDFFEMGKKATDLLISLANETDVQKHIEIPYEFVHRKSTMKI